MIKLSKISCLLAAIILLLAASSCGSSADDKIKPSENSFALYGATIIDGTGNTPIENGVIIVKDGRIEAVGEDESIDIPKDMKKYDLAGATVLPGFINAHVHSAYKSGNLQSWAQTGVTTVRDLGPAGNADTFLKDRDSFNKNVKNARIISATPLITAPGGYGSVFVDSPSAAAGKVKEYIAAGADIIKIAVEDDLQGRKWSMLSYGEIKSMVDTAHAGNRKVAAHVSHTRNLKLVIDAGVDDIAHMVVEPLDDANIKSIVEKDIYWEPTLELWKIVSEMYSLDWINIAKDNLSKFYRAGGKVALGTDFAGYYGNFDTGFPITEVRLMKEAGMSNMDIIIAGTKNAAHVSDADKYLGTLEKGKEADILVVKGNPLVDIEALNKPYMVFHGGVVVHGEDNK